MKKHQKKNKINNGRLVARYYNFIHNARFRKIGKMEQNKIQLMELIQPGSCLDVYSFHSLSLFGDDKCGI